jgi:hypothetical protein
VTLVDVESDVADTRRMSISARHQAVLADGRRLPLLDGRGWSSSLRRVRTGEAPGDGRLPDIWAVTSVEEIEETARVVVGPDEPFDGHSQQDMETDHWAHLSRVLGQQGVVADALELRRLPHDVVLSERLLAHLGRDHDAVE